MPSSPKESISPCYYYTLHTFNIHTYSLDYRRAEKCYQKAVALQPSNPEASLCLGDVLWSNGEEVSIEMDEVIE